MEKFNRIQIKVQGQQEHINARNKIYLYQINNQESALRDLQDILQILQFDGDFPKKIIDGDFYLVSDYVVTILFYNEYHIVTFQGKNDFDVQQFSDIYDAENYYEKYQDLINDYCDRMEELNAVKDIYMYVNLRHFKSLNPMQCDESILQSQLVKRFLVYEDQGDLVKNETTTDKVIYF
jgi:hypothetical protein